MPNIERFTIIGAGAMGAAFAKGVIRAGLLAPDHVTLADMDHAKLQDAASGLGANVTTDNRAAVRDADVVLIAVKPGIVAGVLSEIGGELSRQLIVSIAAGVRLPSIEDKLPDGIGVVRAMPNTPCQIGEGAIGFSRGTAATDEQVGIAKSVFDAVGAAFEVPEKLLDAVTGLSGSGPAYVYLMIEAMSDAGVRVGLPRNISLELASQTVMGTARMVIESREHPAVLKDQVTSPGGTTIAALDVLEHAGFRAALIDAVKAAKERSEELA